MTPTGGTGGAAFCVQGATYGCTCPGGGQGIQTCQANGTWTACSCAGTGGVGPAGSGGWTPTGGVGGTAGVSGTSGTGGGAAPGQMPCGQCASLDTTNTYAPLLSVTLTECCVTGENVCGSISSATGTTCIERDQPGSLNAQCPTETPAALYGLISLQGCCKPDGRCGVDVSILQFGCWTREDIPPALGLGIFAPMTCVYTP